MDGHFTARVFKFFEPSAFFEFLNVTGPAIDI